LPSTEEFAGNLLALLDLKETVILCAMGASCAMFLYCFFRPDSQVG